MRSLHLHSLNCYLVLYIVAQKHKDLAKHSVGRHIHVNIKVNTGVTIG